MTLLGVGGASGTESIDFTLRDLACCLYLRNFMVKKVTPPISKSPPMVDGITM
jgi:hypothetical protein